MDNRKIKIIGILLVSFVFVLFLNRYVFIGDSPKINTAFLARFFPTAVPTMTVTPTISEIISPVVSPLITPLLSPTVTPILYPTIPPTVKPTRTPKPSPTPLPQNSSCPTNSGEHYDTRGLGHPFSGAETSPDTNAFLRGWNAVSETLGLVNYGYKASEPPDPNAPQLGSILNNGVQFTGTYKIHQWDWTNNKPSTEYEGVWPVHVLGLLARPGQIVAAPISGYNIGGGYQNMVIYADATHITMNITGDDDAINGYAIHIGGFCVDPNLLALYRQSNAAGRQVMPVLHGGQTIGTAKTGEVFVMVRDSGQFMDPRSHLDWWKGY